MKPLPDYKKRLLHCLLFAAMLALAALCVDRGWIWAFFLLTPVLCAWPDVRRQLWRRAEKLAGLFVLASLIIFMLPVAFTLWAFRHSQPFNSVMGGVGTEMIFLATIGLGALILRPKNATPSGSATHLPS